MRAAVNDRVVSRKDELLLHWSAQHLSEEGITKMTQPNKTTRVIDSSAPSETGLEAGGDWQQMANFFGGIK